MIEKEPVAPEPKTSSGFDPGSWITRLIMLVVLVVVGYIAYQISASFFPRWWAQRIGNQVNGSFASGTMWGLLYGFTFSFFPVLVFAEVRRSYFNWPGRILVTLVAVALATPNWLTLSVVAGTNNAAHAGERIMDVEAPGFRSATLIGVIVGVVLALVLVAVLINLKHRRHQVRTLKAEIKAREAAEKQAARDAAKAAKSGKSTSQDVPPEGPGPHS